MPYPIDSRLIFKILQALKRTDKRSPLYTLLFLDNNDGASFYGEKFRGIKKSWWPDQFTWAYNRWVAFNYNEDCLFSNNQKFPLEDSDYAYSKTQVYMKFCNEGRVTETLKRRLDSGSLLTFESYLFAVLEKEIENNPTYGSLDIIKNVCRSHDIPKKQLDRVERFDDHKELLEYLIMQAKAAKDGPLEVEDDFPLAELPIPYPRGTRFALRHLRSMLEGCQPTQLCWAAELRDAYGVAEIDIPAKLHDCMTLTYFANDEDFLQTVLPAYLHRALFPVNDTPLEIADLMNGTHSDAHRRMLCDKMRHSFTMDDLQKNCKALNLDERQFSSVYDVLFTLLGEEGKQLRRYQQRCDTHKYPYIGIAMLVVYTLLGSKYFYHLVPDEADAKIVFHEV